MKKSATSVVFACAVLLWLSAELCGQSTPADPGTPPDNAGDKQSAHAHQQKGTQAYSGMYTFLKDGEFLQVTVEDDARVTGFISRFGDTESDKGAFLDQFFKSGKIEGN